MAVIGGGLSGFLERTFLGEFGNDTYGFFPVYIGLSTTQPLDVSNFGSSVTYGAASLLDSQNYFPYNLAGAGIRTASGSTGTVLSNTINTVLLTGNWTGGTPPAGTQYDIFLFSEPSGNNYSRVSLANNSTNFVKVPASGAQVNYSGSIVTTGVQINFPPATGAGWGHIVSVFVTDTFPSRNTGNMLWAQPLATPQYVLGGQTLAIPAGALSIGLK